MTTKLLGYKDLCPMFGRSYKTIHRWVAEGKFPPPVKVNNTTLGWKYEVVQDWLDKQEG